MARRARRRGEWRRIVDELERSGLTAREFAARHDLNASTLGWWRGRFRREAREAAGAGRFVPVVVAAAAPSASTGWVEVALPGGAVLRFERRLDVAGLRELAVAFGATR